MFTIYKEEYYMCVGLPARVVKVHQGMALVDASGAKRKYRQSCWMNWIPAIM